MRPLALGATRTLLVVGLALFTSCSDPTDLESQEAPRVLFIGNSLTYFNDMPGMLNSFLRASGRADAYVASAAYPNFGLPDHWTMGASMDSIAVGSWDYVIFQQGPSATEGRPYLIEWAPRFADTIRAVGAEPGVYMVWPAESRSFEFGAVAESYRTAAENTDALLFPVGEAWLEVWELDPDVELYGPDRFHPSEAASYLAAAIIFASITGDDPRELPLSINTSAGTIEIPPAIADVLQRVATAYR